MPKFPMPIQATGPDGNTFVILGKARQMMLALGESKEDRDKLVADVLASKSYGEALDFIREWFPVDLGPT